MDRRQISKFMRNKQKRGTDRFMLDKQKRRTARFTLDKQNRRTARFMLDKQNLGINRFTRDKRNNGINRSSNKAKKLNYSLRYCLSIVLLLLLITGCSKNKNMLNSADFLLVSHRGVPSETPEHSFDGYDLAIEQGSEYIELDIVTSKDGYLVISHDLTLKRDTGVNKVIAELTMDEIRQYKKSNGEYCYHLEEVFQRYGDRVNYVLEIKEDRDDRLIEDKVLSLVSQYDLADHVLLESFHGDTIDYLYEKEKGLPYVYLLNSGCTLDAVKESLEMYGYADGLGLEYGSVSKAVIETIHAQNKKVYVYFHNESESKIRRVLDLGVDGVFTDYTQRSLDILQEY